MDPVTLGIVGGSALLGGLSSLFGGGGPSVPKPPNTASPLGPSSLQAPGPGIGQGWQAQMLSPAVMQAVNRRFGGR